MNAFKHVYGPVPSRRLGRSLGIDLVPFKVCTYDCVYCQLGRTIKNRIEPKEYVPLDTVVEEARRKLDFLPKPDYITLSGSGEPTLYSRIGELIEHLKSFTDVPVAVITNGSLLWKPEIRKRLSNADLVIPSLDAGDEILFKSINRPHKKIGFERMVDGLVTFRAEFSNTVWLEIFLLGGMNAIPSEVEKIAAITRKIKPDKIHLNTVARPPAEEFAFPVKPGAMREYEKMFSGKREIIKTIRKTRRNGSVFTASDQDVLELLARRPCAITDIANGLSIPPNEAIKHVDSLLAQNNVLQIQKDGALFYTAAWYKDSTQARKKRKRRIMT